MRKCALCGKKFDPEDAEQTVDNEFEEGLYDDQFPDHDVCEDCAINNILENLSAGEQLMELMGDQWDDD